MRADFLGFEVTGPLIEGRLRPSTDQSDHQCQEWCVHTTHHIKVGTNVSGTGCDIPVCALQRLVREGSIESVSVA